MNNTAKIRSLLKHATKQQTLSKAIFYKTGKGDYAEHDQFIGVNVPTLREIAKPFQKLEFDELQALIGSPINEERFLALVILVHQYQTGNHAQQEKVYEFYVKNLTQVNNWNLVDASAHLILGAHLWQKDKAFLLELAASPSLWDRRIAIVSTWYFIRQEDLNWTFKIATLLLQDPQDLIHKAVGWMLREAGKKNQTALTTFLDQHIKYMPRTLLRYAIEKFPEPQRQFYLHL